VRRFGDRLDGHPLRRQIITTAIVNDLVDRAGATFVFRAQEETGATASEVVRAYTVAREVFAVEELWREVEALDGLVPTSAQALVLLESRRLLDRTTRWLLQSRRSSIDVVAEVARFRGPLDDLTPRLPDLLAGVEAQRLARRSGELAAAGLPEPLAVRTACLLDAFSLLDVVEIAADDARPVDEVAGIYFALSDRFEIDRMLTTISGLPRADRWQALARSALRYDLYAALAGLTSDVLSGAVPGEPAPEAIARWERANGEGLTRARSTLQEVVAADRADLATMSVALRTVRTLLPG
jgi:glutamate dehydrogenase